MRNGRSAAGMSSELWAFDVKAMEWEQIVGDGMLPDPREQGTLTHVLTRFLLLFGGVGAEMSPMLDLNLFDLATQSWSVHRPNPSLPRIGHVAGYASGQLYIFGGSLRRECERLEAARVRLRQAPPISREHETAM